MNKKFLGICMSLLILPIIVNASGLDIEDLPDPGVLPSSMFWGLELAFERVNLFFTFNSDSRIKKNNDFARERIAEAQAESRKGNNAGISKALEQLERIQNDMVLTESILGKPLRTTDEEIDSLILGHITILNAVKDSISIDNNTNNDNAIVGITNAIDKSTNARKNRGD